MPTGVTLTSLKINKKQDTKIQAYILCNEVSVLRQKQFLSLNSDDFKIELIDVSNIKLPENIEHLTEHVSLTAIYKFYIPSLFEKIDRMLYLDGDLIIQNDISEIYNIDMGENYAAVVNDMAPMILYKPSIDKKLGVEIPSYFNSGVMLFNLKKMRKDDIGTKLIDYRVHGINFFMDQDAFNVVLKDGLIYLPIWDNYLVTLDGKFSAQELSAYYGVTFPIEIKERWQKAIILHMASKAKPWIYKMPLATELFMKYYLQSPYSEELIKFLDLNSTVKNEETDKMSTEKIKVPSSRNVFNYNLSHKKGCYRGEERKTKIVVSLTSFPARIKSVDKVIYTLLNQSMKPDHVILWLAEDEFPGKESDLPRSLLALRKHGLEICWCENLAPHKKYYYSMLKYQNDIVITVDDDIAYSKYLVETLFNSYKRHPDAISALRVHLMKFNEDGKLLPYTQWYYCCKNYVDIPLRSLFATGAGGILYPPHLINEEWKNIEELRKSCLYADDIWLKTMEIMNDIPVVLASKYQELIFIGDTQQTSLYSKNVYENKNDVVLKNLFDKYDKANGIDDTLLGRIKKDIKTPQKIAKISKPKKNSFDLKNKIKKILPMPVNSLMREFRILKRDHKELRCAIRACNEKSMKENKEIRFAIRSNKEISQKENKEIRFLIRGNQSDTLKILNKLNSVTEQLALQQQYIQKLESLINELKVKNLESLTKN